MRFEHNYKDKDCKYPLLYIVMPHGSYVYALLVDDLLTDDWEIYEDEKTFDVV